MKVKTIVPLEILEIESDNYHLFVLVKIGRRNARMLLDTGASKTAFDSNQIKKFIGKNEPENLGINSVGLGSNQVATHLTQLTSLKIGEIALKKVDIAVLDLAHVNEAYQILGFPEIDGVLGSDILVKLKAIINLEKLVLKLKL
ncbi:MAG: retroviral-like aspartic protease family protein [Bacteroidia bacterium]|nr:retroviral-like aspartic protease family protein [Bacteroidia bacterium]MCF8447524.1 retroviral-like aspartic protease family protein [Bacteroidia bacterium]